MPFLIPAVFYAQTAGIQKSEVTGSTEELLSYLDSESAITGSSLLFEKLIQSNESENGGSNGRMNPPQSLLMMSQPLDTVEEDEEEDGKQREGVSRKESLATEPMPMNNDDSDHLERIESEIVLSPSDVIISNHFQPPSPFSSSSPATKPSTVDVATAVELPVVDDCKEQDTQCEGNDNDQSPSSVRENSLGNQKMSGNGNGHGNDDDEIGIENDEACENNPHLESNNLIPATVTTPTENENENEEQEGWKMKLPEEKMAWVFAFLLRIMLNVAESIRSEDLREYLYNVRMNGSAFDSFPMHFQSYLSDSE